MKKLSAILIELAETALAQPVESTSAEGLHAALMLAHVTWNRAIDLDASDTEGRYLSFMCAAQRRRAMSMLSGHTDISNRTTLRRETVHPENRQGDVR